MVYDSILTKRKKRFHEEIGNAIEEIYEDNLDEYYVVLADQYTKSENYVPEGRFATSVSNMTQSGACPVR